MHALGAELHNRLGTLAGHLAKVGPSLDCAVGAYNQAVGSFGSRVLVSARRLEAHRVARDARRPAQVERQARSIVVHEPTRRPSLSSRGTPTPPDGVARWNSPALAHSIRHSRGDD